MATTDASLVGVATAILIFLPGLFLNGMFLFMYGRRDRLQIPVVYFLASLSVLNIICLLFWITTSMIAQFGYSGHLDQAAPANGYCQFQGILLTYYQTMNMHTFCLMALERVLKFYKPTLHTEVFYNDMVVIVALVVMWILELVPALFHVMTWGTVKYMTDQYQCAYDDTVATSRLNAMFMYTYIIPFLFCTICMICVIVKYYILKSRVGVSPGYNNDTVVEEDLTNGGRTVRAGDKNQRRNPYHRDDDSDEEDGYNALFAVYGEDDKDSGRQRMYKYREREIEFALLVLFIFLLFIVLWIMYIVVLYMRAYDPIIVLMPTALPGGLETAATFLSHATMSLCPCLYWIVNRRFRRHIRLACNCVDTPKQEKVQPRPQQTYNEPVYRRNAGGPQVRNIHAGDLGDIVDKAY